MNDLHEVQKAMIRFVQGLGDIYPHELKTAFEALYEELNNTKMIHMKEDHFFI